MSAKIGFWLIFAFWRMGIEGKKKKTDRPGECSGGLLLMGWWRAGWRLLLGGDSLRGAGAAAGQGLEQAADENRSQDGFFADRPD